MSSVLLMQKPEDANTGTDHKEEGEELQLFRFEKAGLIELQVNTDPSNQALYLRMPTYIKQFLGDKYDEFKKSIAGSIEIKKEKILSPHPTGSQTPSVSPEQAAEYINKLITTKIPDFTTNQLISNINVGAIGLFADINFTIAQPYFTAEIERLIVDPTKFSDILDGLYRFVKQNNDLSNNDLMKEPLNDGFINDMNNEGGTILTKLNDFSKLEISRNTTKTVYDNYFGYKMLDDSCEFNASVRIYLTNQFGATTYDDTRKVIKTYINNAATNVPADAATQDAVTGINLTANDIYSNKQIEYSVNNNIKELANEYNSNAGFNNNIGVDRLTDDKVSIYKQGGGNNNQITVDNFITYILIYNGIITTGGEDEKKLFRLISIIINFIYKIEENLNKILSQPPLPENRDKIVLIVNNLLINLFLQKIGNEDNKNILKERFIDKTRELIYKAKLNEQAIDKIKNEVIKPLNEVITAP